MEFEARWPWLTAGGQPSGKREGVPHPCGLQDAVFDFALSRICKTIHTAILAIM